LYMYLCIYVWMFLKDIYLEDKALSQQIKTFGISKASVKLSSKRSCPQHWQCTRVTVLTTLSVWSDLRFKFFLQYWGLNSGPYASGIA
jgi:hypothetical protein